MTLDMSYNSNRGGITWKSDAGTFLYDYPGKPYAVSGIDTAGVGLVFPEYAQEIGYTSFESVSTISENDYLATFTYNSDNQRAKMVVQQNGNTVLTRWYPGSSYVKETTGGVTKEYTFIGGDAYSAPVVAVKTNGGEAVYYYLLRDYVGSITHVVDATSNSVVEEYSYDSWGRMRNPVTWENYPPGSEPAPFIAGRGYTGHEHLPWFSFINMNGRVYDPLTGQFLSPDNYVQTPDFTQNFNRYTYCFNNPLKYTDPSGEIIFTILAAIFCQPLLPVAIGTDIGWISGGIRGNKTPGMTFWDGAWRGGVVGAVGGALSMVGGGTFVVNVAWGMGQGAITGGLDAALWGNNVGKGMLWGAAIGGAFAAATSGIESYKNYRDYGKFGTDVGIYDRMVNDVQSAYLNNDFSQLNSSLKTLNEFGADRFGFYSKIEFGGLRSATTPDGRAAVAFFDQASDGSLLRRSGAAMRRSMAHESAHIKNIYINIEGKEEISRNFFKGDDLFVLGVNHGTVGYYEPIRNAGKLHLGFSVLELNRPGTLAAWKQFGWKKWLYTIPRRY